MKINYTYYKKLKQIFKNKNINEDEINKEKEEILLKIKNSSWGLTNAQKTYIDLLEQIIIVNKSIFKRIKLKKMEKKIENNFDKKIRVVFFCYEFQTFPSFLSLYNNIKDDADFICQLVHIPFFHVDKKYDETHEIKDYTHNGFNEIISSEDYNLVLDSPDIAFFLKPYDLIPPKFYIDEIDKVIEKVIYIPYGMEIGATLESMRYQFKLPLHEKAWYCISYCTKHYENACKYSKLKGKNFQMIGHPRMDLIHLDLTNEKLFKKIKKMAKEKYIFMYNPHFTIGEGDNWGAFKNYGIEILKYFANHKELFLIYRPHPFLKEVLNKELDDDLLYEYNEILTNNRDNIYLDESGNYLISMHLANCMISDANSFVPEFLCYNKPVIYTKKLNTTGFKNRNLENMLYICKNVKDVYTFMQKVMIDDEKALNREKNLKKVFNYDKNINVSEKIIKIIKSCFL